MSAQIVRRSLLALVFALALTSCKRGRGASEVDEATQRREAVNQRLMGSWVLVTFQPSETLEPMLASLLAAQFGALTVQFDATSSWDPDNDPLSFSWVFGDGGTSSLPAPTRSYPPGAYEPRVTVSDGSLSSTAALRVVSGNRPPVASILWPPDGATFDAGDVIPIEGVALDPEEGALGPVSLAWTVVFHHNTHTHPYLGPLSGVSSGSFVADESGETAPDIWYEIRLTATDAGAPVGATAWLADMHSVNIYPNLATFTLATAPRPDLTLVLNGTPFSAPRSVLGVVLGVRSPSVSP